MEKKVNFLIAGAQKAGTTALHAYLKLHPEICMAIPKEVHFFDNESFFTQNTVDYSLYHRAFSPNPTHTLLGECTPIYMYWQNAPKRIWQYNPAMKIILILRNPIERAFSHWNMEFSKNKERLSFWEAIYNEQRRCQEALPFQHRVYSYIDRGFYSKQLQKMWRYFPKANTLVLRHEDLKTSPQKTLDEVFGFLGVEKLTPIERQTIFATPYIGDMRIEEKNFLLDIYEDELSCIEKLLNWDCSGWRK
ncbi:sulfotransferase domain-containing protein [Methylovulum miyakonense]|uniref:sulfotransferase domain-containing protein n=1 Tax=Methylovulum miyakonense TaxID=645578 RepID=UPI00037B806C|nr:sulfotransferase domain-containing protein [Methylovulum miyakonense]